MAYAAIAVSAIKTSTPKFNRDHEDLDMKDVVYTFTAFHALAAITIFGFMLFSVVNLVRGKKH
jgi:hypothetical protein